MVMDYNMAQICAGHQSPGRPCPVGLVSLRPRSPCSVPWSKRLCSPLLYRILPCLGCGRFWAWDQGILAVRTITEIPMFKRAADVLLWSFLVAGTSWMSNDPFVGHWKLVKASDEMKVTS